MSIICEILIPLTCFKEHAEIFTISLWLLEVDEAFSYVNFDFPLQEGSAESDKTFHSIWNREQCRLV